MAHTSLILLRRPNRSHRSTAAPPEEAKQDSPALYHPPPKSTIKAATRTRLIFSLFASFLFLVSLIFIILVELGSVYADHRHITGSIYFLKLDVSHVIPQAVPQARLINSIAQTLGLHDFYQVGLWNYCEGYGNDITDCSTPKTLYWFNPVQIILSELLSGATSPYLLFSSLVLRPYSLLTVQCLQSPYHQTSSALSTLSALPPITCSSVSWSALAPPSSPSSQRPLASSPAGRLSRLRSSPFYPRSSPPLRPPSRP